MGPEGAFLAGKTRPGPYGQAGSTGAFIDAEYMGTSQVAVLTVSIGLLRVRGSAGHILGVALVILGITLIQLMKPR